MMRLPAVTAPIRDWPVQFSKVTSVIALVESSDLSEPYEFIARGATCLSALHLEGAPETLADGTISRKDHEPQGPRTLHEQSRRNAEAHPARARSLRLRALFAHRRTSCPAETAGAPAP